MKKKIAIWMPGGVGGGRFSQGVPVISDLVTQLANDYDVTLFSFHATNPDFTANGFRVITAAAPIRINFFRWISLAVRFVRTHARHRFQLLYSFWGFPSGFIVVCLGKTFRLPTIVHLQGGDVVFLEKEKYGSLQNTFFKRLAKWTYNNANELIALTRYQKEFVNRLEVHRDVNVVPFGIELSRFPVKEWNYHGKRELRCLHVANQSSVKDQATLLKMFALLSKKIDARLKIVGEHVANGVLQNICQQLSITNHVEFFEPVRNTELSSFFSWADVFILTSVYEAQGVVLSEAAASGNLLAGTSVGLLSDLGENYAVIVGPGEFKKLALKIEQVTGNLEIVNSRLHAARRWVSQHDVCWSTQEIKKILEKLLVGDRHER